MRKECGIFRSHSLPYSANSSLLPMHEAFASGARSSRVARYVYSSKYYSFGHFDGERKREKNFCLTRQCAEKAAAGHRPTDRSRLPAAHFAYSRNQKLASGVGVGVGGFDRHDGGRRIRTKERNALLLHSPLQQQQLLLQSDEDAGSGE